VVDDGGTHRTQPAPDEIARRGGRRRAVGEQVHEERVERVVGRREAESHDELQDQRHGERGVLLQDPAVGDVGEDTEGDQGQDGHEAGALDGEVAQIVAALAVDGEPEPARCAAVVEVEQLAVEDGGEHGTGSEGAVAVSN